MSNTLALHRDNEKKLGDIDVINEVNKFREVFVVNTDLDNTSDIVTHPVEEMHGEAEFITPGQSNWATAVVTNREISRKVEKIGIAAETDEQSLARNGGISQGKFDAMFRAIENKHNKVAFFGDADRKILGLFSDLDIPVQDVPIDFNTATGAQIIKDIGEKKASIIAATKSIFTPNRMLIPSDYITLFEGIYIAEGGGLTVFEHIQRVMGLTIISIEEARGIGSGGSDVYVLYTSDPLTHKYVETHSFKANQAVTDAFNNVIQASWARTAGFWALHPKSFVIAENIDN